MPGRNVGSVVVLFLTASGAFAQDLYYSLEGEFAAGSDVQQFLFDVDNGVPSFADVRLRTWHHGGIADNFAGDAIPAGGFDPTLRLLNGADQEVAFNDNVFFSLLDAQIVRSGLSDSGNVYRAELEAAGGSLAGLDPQWAIDLLGDEETGLRLAGSSDGGSVRP